MNISETDPDNHEAGDDNANVDSFPQDIKNIIATLRIVIDQIGLGFEQARRLILEIAKRLDEGGLCERDHISITVKKILKDKIKDGKVTEKWIEECLPPEYKRQYTKSELSSLSKQQPKQQIIEVSTEGKQVSQERQDDDKVIDPSTEEQPSSKSGSANKLEQDGEKSYKQTGQECPSCLELQDKVIQLSEALQSISISTADQILVSEFEFAIPRENYDTVKDAMDKSNSTIFVKCDKGKKFVRAVPDIDN